MKRSMVFAVAFAALMVCTAAFAETVDMDAVSRIESSGNAKAFNKTSKARGLFQITPIVLEDFNKAVWNREDITEDELFDRDVNTMIATWYMKVRIPQLLKHFGEEASVRNVLVSWNAGIKYVVEGRDLPDETSNFIQKYQAEVTK